MNSFPKKEKYTKYEKKGCLKDCRSQLYPWKTPDNIIV